MKDASPAESARAFKRAVSTAAVDALVVELLPLVGNARNYRKEALTTLIIEHFPAIGYREAQTLTAEELLPLLTQIRDKLKSKKAGDISGDTQKKTKKPVRRTKVEHCDCERIYQEAKQKGFPLTLTQVVADYLDDNPNCKLTPQALLRGWKEHRRTLRGGDNLGTV